MSNKARFVLAITGMVVILIAEVVAILERDTMVTRPIFILEFAAIAILGFWAMSLHRLGR